MAKKSDPKKKPAKESAKEADLCPRGSESWANSRNGSGRHSSGPRFGQPGACPSLRGPTINGTETYGKPFEGPFEATEQTRVVSSLKGGNLVHQSART